MTEWLGALERLGAVQALKTSFFAYPIVNALHIAAVGALLTSVVLMDLRLLGAFGDLPGQAFVRLMRRVALAAFGLAVATGAAMFAVRASDYAANPLYWAKMALIMLAGLNFLAFSALERRRQHASEPLSAIDQLSVVISLVVWPSVLLVGRFLGFV